MHINSQKICYSLKHSKHCPHVIVAVGGWEEQHADQLQGPTGQVAPPGRPHVGGRGGYSGGAAGCRGEDGPPGLKTSSCQCACACWPAGRGREVPGPGRCPLLPLRGGGAGPLGRQSAQCQVNIKSVPHKVRLVLKALLRASSLKHILRTKAL